MNGVEVSDPFGVVDDPKMPFLKDALDPRRATAQLQSCVCQTISLQGPLSAIRVRRYKPGRRCLIEYELQTENHRPLLLLGKVRAKGTDRTTFEAVQALWQGGFSSDSADGISVPEPIGTVPAFNMWLQAKVTRVEPATHLLGRPEGHALAGRIAEAIHKLHSTNIPTLRQHTLADELAILKDRLGKVQQLRPEWAQRLERLAGACNTLAASASSSASAGIHRDFYPDHVLVDECRLWLVDFDLYCRGDPALDVGNFIAHLTEQSLRSSADPTALGQVERLFENRFVEINGEQVRASINVYATLSLARHIYISTCFPARQPFTGQLLELCEQRLGLA